MVPHSFRFTAFALGVLTLSAWGSTNQPLIGKYDSLKRFNVPIKGWTPEISPATDDKTPPLQKDLSGYYSAFRAKGKIKLYYGLGYESYSPERVSSFYQMIQNLAEQENLALTHWSFEPEEGVIQFTDASNQIQYELTVGHERNQFQSAFSDHEIVMYHGHSRYGRGPAFDGFQNYYRMGNVFNTIEVDTRNPYFQNEPIQKKESHSLLPISLEEGNFFYQYRGGMVESSYLPEDAYTKNIPGMDRDLTSTRFISGKQLLWLYSCSNDRYFKGPLRELFPDSDNRFVFGTNEDGYESEVPAAVFIMSVVAGRADSNEIVNELNAIGDCDDCFTSY